MPHRLLALNATVVGALVLATLVLAGPASARIPPDHETGATTTIVQHTTTSGPVWSYAVVAGAALLLGAVAAYVIARIRFSVRLQRGVTA